MKRAILDNLLIWKNSPKRKPLLIKGARQVGKTWIMKEFGKLYFKQVIYINFERDRLMQNLFENDFDIKRILLALQVQTGIKPEANKTLIIFDEIQEAPGALTSLKYFQEMAPEYYVMGAGSLLGIALSGQSFPVGKVEFIELFPLSFTEFMMALKENELISLIASGEWKLIQSFHPKYVELLKQYFIIGGMPEAVASYSEVRNFDEVRKIQKAILTAYEQDFSKHAPSEIIPRLRMLWNSVPSQLSKENKKFIYGLIKEGARAREYEIALAWLEDYGLIYRVNRITKAGFPLKSYSDPKAFKLFMVDTGLLCTLSGLNEKILLDGNSLFEEFKGALAEQFILQQLISENRIHPFYWTQEKASSEIDFVIEKGNNFYPIEVKSSENLLSKSLRVFNEKYHPKLNIRTSLSGYREESWMVNVPLYAFHKLVKDL